MTRPVAWYALAALLVVGYVNTFVVWQFLQVRLGGATALIPWLLAGVLVVGFVAVWRFNRERAPPRPLLLAGAIAVALAGLLLVDPAYPAKRVHIAQYALLAAVVWQALRPHAATQHRVALTLLIGGLLGVHDEFLQALHPLRTFGTRDMAVNLCGVAAGALALAGLPGGRRAASERRRVPSGLTAAAAMAATGLALYLFALAGLAGAPVPYWPALPLLAGTFALSLALARGDVAADVRHAGTVIAVLLLVLAIYPVLANETALYFA